MRRISQRSTPVDAWVGARVRLRRNMLGLSQERLGAALGLTFQQVQKYESGANRIAASRLHELSRVLDVPVTFFFDFERDEATEAPPVAAGGAKHSQRETQELVLNYIRIGDAATRRALFELFKSVAATTVSS